MPDGPLTRPDAAAGLLGVSRANPRYFRLQQRATLAELLIAIAEHQACGLRYIRYTAPSANSRTSQPVPCGAPTRRRPIRVICASERPTIVLQDR